MNLTHKFIVARNMLNHWLQAGKLLIKTSLDKWGETGNTVEEIFDVLLEDSTIIFMREKVSSSRKIVKILLDKLRINPGWEHAVWKDVDQTVSLLKFVS